ncbi:argininosuccinate lyase [Prauserella cavernicola]|uniref:Argininosuccinate lyase n=1 Tax=Prauserella cavernicola TaxID=2800127 RepID=A0A934V6E3_9PSEU|nr:argininosuccinate lyase [Prauserella cavernicola]MBK1786624.1 argininosuccinate lyase [Prauserella cavernicola]
MPRQQTSAEYRGFRTAGIRLTEDVLPDLESHRTEKLGDTLDAIHQFDKAHLVMLAEQELIGGSDAAAMLSALRDMEKEGVSEVRFRVQGGMHSGEQFLIRTLGEEVGGRIHLGRSSGDLGAVGRRIATRDHLLGLVDAINAFRAVLIELAPEYADVVMPGYTHTQNAQPTTFGHWMSMWSCVFERDVDRLLGCFGRVNVSSAGAGILAGSEFALDRERTSFLLGFDRPSPHTMDAILSHDAECLEAMAVLSIHTANLARLADDLQLWFSSEFGFVDLPDRFCGTSSIMMQKRNPYFCEAAKAVSEAAAGGMTTALMVEKGSTGLPVAGRRLIESAQWTGFSGARRRLEEAVSVFRELTVDRDRMLAVVQRYWAQGADVAGALVREKGLPWRSAHQIIGIVVRYTEERGISPMETTVDLIDEAAVEYFGSPVGLSPEALRTALDPVENVRARMLYGGPAPSALRRELEEFASTLAKDVERCRLARDRVDEGARELELAIDRILDAHPGAGSAA